MEKRDKPANSRHVHTALSPSFFSLSPSLHVDLRPAITHKDAIANPRLTGSRGNIQFFISLICLFSCLVPRRRTSGLISALVRHKHLVVSARLKYGWHALYEQLCHTMVGATRWHRVVSLLVNLRASTQ